MAGRSTRARPRSLLRATLAVGLAAGAGAGSAAAAPSPDGPWIAKDLGKGRAVVAGFPAHTSTPTLTSLVRAWGQPARVSLRSGECRAIWDAPAVRVSLRTLGSIPDGSNLCTPGVGLISNIQTKGPRWRTEKGLRVGDRESRVRQLYPAAFRRDPVFGRQWGLRPITTNRFGRPMKEAGVYAKVSRGRIIGFWISVGAEGE